MDASLYLSKEYNLSNIVFDRDIHWFKLFLDSDDRRRKEEEKIKAELERKRKKV